MHANGLASGRSKMKHVTTTVLALALVVATGAAPAQAFFNNGRGQQPFPDRYGQDAGAVYDWARVIRVDPVITSGNGYGAVSDRQNCTTRRSTYAGNDGYYNDGDYNDGYYRNGSSAGYGGYGDYRNDRYNRNDRYGQSGSQAGSTMATVIGGLVGAAIGSQVGDGSGRYASTAIGSMVGGIAGREIYEASQREQHRDGFVTVCDPMTANSGYGYGGDYRTGNRVGNNRVAGYDVTYQYAGRQFHTRTDYHPGDRIRVRVEVRPE